MNNLEKYIIQYKDPNPDPITGYMRAFVFKEMRWDMETSITQKEYIFFPESTIQVEVEVDGQMVMQDQVIPARHEVQFNQKWNYIYAEYRAFYYHRDETQPDNFGELVNAKAVAQGRVFPFRVTDATWVNAQTGAVIDEIPLQDGQGNLIQEPHQGLIGEYSRFIHLAFNVGVPINQLLVGALQLIIQNQRVD